MSLDNSGYGEMGIGIDFQSKITLNYEQINQYKDGVSGYVDSIVKQGEIGKGFPHEYAFYLNSSDSLVSLARLNLTGKKVMTVSGSGEFSHTFIKAGAKEIISYDISPAAAFYSELRHKALCNLSMKDYVKLFSSWIDKKEEEDAPFLDKDILGKVENFLSKEAKAYFKLIINTPKLINTEKYSWSHFTRMRTNKKYRYNRLIGDIIKKPKDYIDLQNKAKKVKFTQVICDVQSLNSLVKLHQPDTMYISNIGYYPQETIGIAQNCISKGIKEVFCAISKNERDFNDTRSRDQDINAFYHDDRKIVPGSTFKYDIYKSKFSSGGIVSVEVVDTNRDADYGLALKVTK